MARTLRQEAGALGAECVPVDGLRPKEGIEVIVDLDRTYEFEAHAADRSDGLAGGLGRGTCK